MVRGTGRDKGGEVSAVGLTKAPSAWAAAWARAVRRRRKGNDNSAKIASKTNALPNKITGLANQFGSVSTTGCTGGLGRTGVAGVTGAGVDAG